MPPSSLIKHAFSREGTVPHKPARGGVCVWLPFQGVESSSDVALYSGLAAGVVTVVLLIVAVTLYRRSQSDYGVDVIDSSALTGGFQSFSFKTSRQGEPHASAGFHTKPLKPLWKPPFKKRLHLLFSSPQIKRSLIEPIIISQFQICREDLLFCDVKRAIWNDWGLEAFIFCSQPPESHQNCCLGSSCDVHFYYFTVRSICLCCLWVFSLFILLGPAFLPLTPRNGA